MDAPTVAREETLADVLTAIARRRSDARLAADTVVAVVTGISVAAWGGLLWDVRVGAAICCLAFGVWGLADRESLRDTASRARRAFVRGTRLIAAALGFAAGAYLMFALLARAIGRVIS